MRDRSLGSMEAWTATLRHARVRIFGYRCPVCQRPAQGAVCPSCLRESEATGTFVTALTAGMTPLYRVGRYSLGGAPTPLALALIRFKYGSDRAAGHALRRLATLAARTLPSAFDAIVPVPLHRKRLRERGYNQSAWIARGISDGCGIPLDVRALIRTLDRAPQATSRPQTRRQLHDAFRASSRYIAGKRVLLVDDVRTTGATLDDARVALVAAGAASVTVAVLLLAGREDD
jgi:ComF family protein